MDVESFLERNVTGVVRSMERETGRECQFDRAAVDWLERHLRTKRDAAIEERESLVMRYGCFLGQCFVMTFGGTWTMLQGASSGLAVMIRSNTFVVPWDKVEGFLAGDDADSLVGFFALVEQRYRDASRASPVFLC